MVSNKWTKRLCLGIGIIVGSVLAARKAGIDGDYISYQFEEAKDGGIGELSPTDVKNLQEKGWDVNNTEKHEVAGAQHFVQRDAGGNPVKVRNVDEKWSPPIMETEQNFDENGGYLGSTESHLAHDDIGGERVRDRYDHVITRRPDGGIDYQVNATHFDPDGTSQSEILKQESYEKDEVQFVPGKIDFVEPVGTENVKEWTKDIENWRNKNYR